MNVRTRGSPTLPLAMGAVALVGCATTPEGSDAERGPRTAVVEIHNQNWSTVHCYAIAGGLRISLGLVATNRRERFTLPAELFAAGHGLIFQAVPIGSPLAYTSDETLVRPGDTVQMTVRNELAQSFVTVF